MKKLISTVVFVSLTQVMLTQQVVQWGHTLSGNYFEVPYSLMLSDNFIWLTGWTSSDLLYYDTDSIAIGGPNDQMFLLRISADGEKARVRMLGGNMRDVGRTLLPINDQTVFLSGFSYSDSIYLDQVTLYNRGGKDAFIAKMDSNFLIQWVRTFQGNSDDDIRTIKYRNGHVYGGMTFMGSTVLLPNGDTVLNKSVGFNDILIFSMDTSGVLTNYISIKGNRNDVISDLYIDDDNSLYATGFIFSDTLFVGSFAIPRTNAGYTAFIIKLDSLLNPIWVKTWGGNGDDYGWNLILKGSKLFFTGTFTGSYAKFDNLTIQNHTAGYFDIVVGALDKLTGNFLWVKNAGGTDDEDLYTMSLYKDQFVVVGGGTKSSNFEIDSFSHAGNGTWNAMLFIVDTLGNVFYSAVVNQPDNENIWCIATKDENIYIAGTFLAPAYTFFDKTFFNEGEMSTDAFIVAMRPSLQGIHENIPLVRVYPNPASNVVTVFVEYQPALIELFDLHGRVVLRETVHISGETQIPLNGVQDGTYLLKLSSSKGTWFSKILIKHLK